MKNNTRYRQLPMLIFLATLTIGAGWSYLWMSADREAAESSRDNLQACLQLTTQIKKLREKPLWAGSSTRSAGELARILETSAKKANIPAGSIVQIDPQPARRLGKTAYKEQPTHIELQDIALKQLVFLLLELTDEESGAELAELRLSAPRDEPSSSEKQELWNAEVTLTHLIFSP